MSQPQQILLTDLKEWLKKETTSVIEPLKAKGTNLLKEIKERLNDAVESSRKISENSGREMEKNNSKTYRFARNANKFSQNLAKTMEALKIPEQVTYANLQALHDDFGKLLASIELQRREAYPYITPYFIFDRRRLDVMLKRLADMHPELHNFLTLKYAKAKQIEETSAIVDRLSETLNQMNETKKEREKIQEKEKVLQQKLLETQQRIAQIQAKVELIELLNVEERIKELREKVKDSLRYLQKPFFKLQSLARSGDVAIPVDEAKKLSDYLSDPFEALATEGDGYPSLKGILRKLDDAVNFKKLRLKSTRLRKAQEQIDSVLNKESLNSLHKNCIEARAQKTKMLTSNTVAALQNELTQLQNELAELQKENEFTTARDKALESENRKLLDRTENLKRELEKTIHQLTNKGVQVVFHKPNKP